MLSRIPDRGEALHPRTTLPPTDDVEELSLLLPAWQVSALEETAHAQGLTTAAMLRRLIEDFFRRTQRLSHTGARQGA